MTWVAPAASALLLFVAFLPGPFAWAGFTWAVPLALWAMAEPEDGLWRRRTGWAALLTWVALLAWLRHVHPPLGWLGWSLLSAYCALYLWAWLLAVRWVLPWSSGRGLADRLLAVAGLAALWVLLEALRGWALTGFGWLPLAASQAHNPVMLALCESAGQLGLSGALILANLSLARWIRRQFVETRPTGDRAPSLLGGFTPELYLGLAPVLVAFWLHLSHLADAARDEAEGRGSTLRVAVVQTDVDPYRKWDPASANGLLRQLGAMTADVGADADLVLWPEAASPFPLSDPAYGEFLGGIAAATTSTLVIGAVDNREGGYTNSIAAIGAEGLLGAPYDKRHLVPFGEYVPLADLLPLRKLVPIPQDCVPGTAPRLLAVPDAQGRAALLGPLVCYEDIFPSLARDHALAGAQALVVLTNDAWYGRELGAWQHAAHSVLLAAATRLPVARCGNAGWSGWIEPSGRAFPALDREGSIYFRGAASLGERRIPAADRPATRWTSVGDIPLLLPCGGLVILLAMRRRRHPMGQAAPAVGDANR